MKFFAAFAAVLVVILFCLRFVPAAPANPALPMGPHHRESGHDAGSSVEPSSSVNAPASLGEAPQACDQEKEEAALAQSGEPAPAHPGHNYGALVNPAGAVPMSGLALAMGGKDSIEVKLVGKAVEVCQAKGCWMTLPTADGKAMRVRFKDYAFFVPKNLGGHEVIVQGWAHREVVPVAFLQHYAKDAGKSAKEIAAITKDEEQLTFEADGVRVVN